MKKLFFAISIIAANIFTHQAVRPQSDAPIYPQEIFVDSKFRCTHVTSLFANTFYCVEYQIWGQNNKTSPLSADDSDDLMLIGLTSHTAENGLFVSAHVVNTNISKSITCMNSTFFSTHVLVTRQPSIELLLQDLIRFTLSGYLRIHLRSTVCAICSKEIKRAEQAAILNCGNGAHESCLTQEPTKHCRFCGNNVSNEVWWTLIPLP